MERFLAIINGTDKKYVVIFNDYETRVPFEVFYSALIRKYSQKYMDYIDHLLYLSDIVKVEEKKTEIIIHMVTY